MMSKRVYIVGVGITKFVKPFSKKWDYPDMAKEAGQAALKDSRLEYEDINAVVASFLYGDSASGQRAVYELGLSGVPVFNVNNNCASGSTALMVARNVVMSGMGDCVMAVGFEKMGERFAMAYPEKTIPVGLHFQHMHDLGADPGLVSPTMNTLTSDLTKLFAYAAREYQEKYPNGDVKEALVGIAYKNRKHGVHNPNAMLQDEISKDSIANEDALCPPITLSMGAPLADGSATAIVCSESFVQKHELEDQAVEILTQHMVTDLPSSFGKSYIDLTGYTMSKKAAQKCFAETKLSPTDVDVVEVHDCYSCNEMLVYEALGLCPEGSAAKMVENGQWEKTALGGELFVLGGKWVVNPSGGLESRGHAIGATGISQCVELVNQLRGQAGKRQVEGASIAMQHSFGLGGAALVTLFGNDKRKMLNSV